MEGRVFEMFLIKFKSFQNSKNAQNRSQIVQKCFEHVSGSFFRKFFCPVCHGGSSLRNVFKKSKNFQNSKNAQNRSQECPNVFEHVLGYFFREIFLAQCSKEGRVFEMFLKKFKIFKIPKTPKIVPRLSKSVLNMFWGTFFGFFLPSVPWRVESSKCFQKIKKISNFQKCPKIVPKSVETCFEHVLVVIFSRNFSCSVFHGGSRLRNFFKKFSKFKDAQNRSQNVQTCFEHVLGYFFEKIFLPSVPWRVESSKCF